MDQIPLMKVAFTDDDIQSVVKVLKSGMLVQGKEVAALENTVSNYLDIENVVAASNGTATLHLALIALGVGPGDEVIVPAFSYIATANVVELVGATPVFVDIELSTFNIDVSLIEQKINSNTKAIIPVHEFGLMSDMNPILEIAQRHDLFVIEDAACALGATYYGRYAGTFGDIGSFSLHPRKAITSGEGGLLTTAFSHISDKLKVLRNHGVGQVNGKSEFVEAGFNYRLTDIQAALVNSQFERFDKMLAAKERLATYYFENLKGVEGITLPSIPENHTHSWQTFHILIDENRANRDFVIQELKSHGIGTNYGAQCMPYQKFYQDKYKLDCKELFPNALRSFNQGLALPLYFGLNYEEVDKITNVLKTIL